MPQNHHFPWLCGIFLSNHFQILFSHDSLKDLYLAGFHRFQRPFMSLRRHSGATKRIYHDRYLRQKCFQQHGVGDHADICAKPDQCNTVNGLWFIKFFQNFSQGFASKGWLVNGSGLQKLCNLLPDFPTIGTADAMLYRKPYEIRHVF